MRKLMCASLAALLASPWTPTLSSSRSARSEAPLRCALAAIARRLLETKAWEPLGFARIGDYARERAGVSGRQLYELARMDRVLREMPALRHAFLDGQLSWSQACLLARVATPENAPMWLARAASRRKASTSGR